MILHHVMVEPDGSIRQQGHGHVLALTSIRLAKGCKLLVFLEDPQVKGGRHGYDFETSSFSPIRNIP